MVVKRDDRPKSVTERPCRRPLHFAASILAIVAAVALSFVQARAADAPSPAVIPASKIIRQVPDTQWDSWRATLLGKRNENPGCYKAHYPDAGWTAVPCIETRTMNRVPPSIRTGQGALVARPEITGKFNDYMALSSSQTTSATGSIVEIDNLTSESDSGLGSGKYSLQMNTNGFTPPSTICASCTGAVQFYYDQNGGGILVQYWMLNYIANAVTACPAGWNTSGTSCFKNGSACNDPKKVTSAPAPIVALADLPQIKLTGQAFAGGNDTVSLAYGPDIVQQSGCDSILSLSGNWTATEFNVFGDFSGDAATFNSGVLMTVDVSLTDTTADFPACTTVAASSSASTIETTNMNLGACEPTRPGISFVEGVPPVIASVQPNFGSADGGTPVVITGGTGISGSGFSPFMQAEFGTTFVGAECAGNQCRLDAPRGTGNVPVAIENLTSVGAPGVLSLQPVTYQYAAFPFGLLSPTQGPQAGGSKITLSGHGFGTSPGSTAVTFRFPSGSVGAGNVSCATTSASTEFPQTCTLTTPPLPDPPSFGSVVVPVTASAGGLTSPVGGFTYVGATPAPPTCEECIEQGERCVIRNRIPICMCQKSSPTGVCE